MTAVCSGILLSGCQLTDSSSQQHEYDAAATLGNTNSTQTVTAPTTPRVAPSSLDKIITASWQYRRQLDSDNKKISNNSLEDLSPAAIAVKRKQYQKFINQLDQLDIETLDQTQQINRQLLRGQLQELDDYYGYKLHYMPLTSEYGFHVAIANTQYQHRFDSLQDYQDYLNKLTQVPRYFQQQQYWMTQGLEQGITQPKAVLNGFEQTIKNYISVDAQTSSFYQPFKSIKLAITDQQKLALQNQALKVISHQVVPSYQKFYDFMTKQYIPNARQTTAAAALPNGAAMYQNRVNYYTTLDITPEQVHQLGLKEVARIRGEMQEIISQLNFKGSFSDFLQFLRTDPQFYAKTPQQLLEKAAWLSKKADAMLPKLFNKLPSAPYGVAPVPHEIAPKYTTGRYKHAGSNDEAAYYWVNTYALDKRPLYVLPALTLHEAVPGHHLQISLNQELDNLPEFRRQSYISAFGEGWGLYAEWLGVETNYYATPYEQFGRLTYEMWRACRLVVDTGLHAKGWTRQQVIDYMSENTALSLHNITTETDRYISWPGQALSYKMGELTIKRLRRKSEQALGKKFDVKVFHNNVLSQGSVPLNILEQQIDRYISDTLAQ